MTLDTAQTKTMDTVVKDSNEAERDTEADASETGSGSSTDYTHPTSSDLTSASETDPGGEEELGIHGMIREAKREYWEGKTKPLP